MLHELWTPDLLAAAQNALNLTRENSRRFLNPQIGILSLTEVPNNTLMWSRYAASHTGLAVGFGTRDGQLQRVRNKCVP